MSSLFLTIKMSLEILLSRFFGVKSQKGVTMIEYALIAGLISVAVIAILITMSGSLKTIFNSINTALGNAT
jgi:pilus assembly protein Flp/PilA